MKNAISLKETYDLSPCLFRNEVVPKIESIIFED